MSYGEDKRERTYFIVTGGDGDTFPTKGNGSTTTVADGICPAGTRARLTRVTELIPGSGGTVSIVDGAGDPYAQHAFILPTLFPAIGKGAQIDFDMPLDNGLGVSLSGAGKVIIEYTLED